MDSDFKQLNLVDENGEELGVPYYKQLPAITRKSNILINRIGKPTLFSEKLFLYAVPRINYIEPDTYKGTVWELYFKNIYNEMQTDFSTGYISEIKNTAFRNESGMKSGSYYDQIKQQMNDDVFMNAWKIIYNDPKQGFGSTSIITGTYYDKNTGTAYIKWNPDVIPWLIDLKGDYTELDRNIMYGFSSLASFSLYQLLRQKISYMQAEGKRKGIPVCKEYEFSISTSELKFLLGLLRVDTGAVSAGENRLRSQIKGRQYDAAEQTAYEIERARESEAMPGEYVKNVKYIAENKYFRRSYLQKAYEDINGFAEKSIKSPEDFENACRINHTTDIHFRYSLRSSKKKGSSVTFWIRWDKPWEKEQVVDMPAHVSERPVGDEGDVASDDIIDELIDVIDEKLKIKDLRAIADAAGGNIGKVKAAYAYVKTKKGITNLVGYLIAAIKEGWKENGDTAGSYEFSVNTEMTKDEKDKRYWELQNKKNMKMPLSMEEQQEYEYLVADFLLKR